MPNKGAAGKRFFLYIKMCNADFLWQKPVYKSIIAGFIG